MSISYFGVPTNDPSAIGGILEGTDETAARIDAAAIRASLKRIGLEGPDRGTLRWDGEGSYVFVDVLPHYVEVTHGTGGGDEQLFVVMDAIATLQKHGLHVWDPQQGSWFPG